jgi:hypothetical protein
LLLKLGSRLSRSQRAYCEEQTNYKHSSLKHTSPPTFSWADCRGPLTVSQYEGLEYRRVLERRSGEWHKIT